MTKKLFTAILLCGVFLCCNAANISIKAVPVKADAVKLDGILDEAVWKNAARYSKFSKLAHPEIPAAEATVFQVAASPDGVYFAFDICDKNIVATLDQFDSDLTKFNDVIEVFISADDPLPDDANVRTARQLIFNFKGTRADGSYLAGVRDGSWTSDWQVAVKRTAAKATAELFVPFYALDMVNAQNKNLRFNIGRENINADGKKEISLWQNASSFMDMTKFAVLELPVKDLNSGMKCYRMSEASQYLELCPDTMAFSDVILLLMANDRKLVVETPIVIQPRTAGVSTISTRTALITVAEILNLAVLLKPMTVFFRAGVFFLLLGIAWGSFTYIKSTTLTSTAVTLLIFSALCFSLGLLGEQLTQLRKAIARRK